MALPLTIDDVLPNPRYRIAAEQLIEASQEHVWDVLTTLPMSALPMAFSLTRIRHLPAVLAGREPAASRTEAFFDVTPAATVVNDPPRAIILAGPSQAWKLTGGAEPPFVSAVDFAEWSEPGWIKVAMESRLTPISRSTLLQTETRITAPDRATARAFAPYWLAIRTGSALMRREVVRNTAKRSITLP